MFSTGCEPDRDTEEVNLREAIQTILETSEAEAPNIDLDSLFNAINESHDSISESFDNRSIYSLE